MNVPSTTRKNRVILLGAVLILAAVALMSTLQTEAKATFVSDGEELATVTLEVADTGEERQQGLMHRQSLAENHGMIFVYSDEDTRTFWMKNTYIPLDMIFIAEDGTIVDIQEADPEPNTPDHELERYTSLEPAMYVIEVNQGFSEKHGIEIGDQILLDY